MGFDYFRYGDEGEEKEPVHIVGHMDSDEDCMGAVEDFYYAYCGISVSSHVYSQRIGPIFYLTTLSLK